MEQTYTPNKGKEDCKHPVCNIDSTHKYVYCMWCGKEFVPNLNSDKTTDTDKKLKI